MHGYLSIRDNDNAEMNSNFRLYLSPFPNRKSVGVKKSLDRMTRSFGALLDPIQRFIPLISVRANNTNGGLTCFQAKADAGHREEHGQKRDDARRENVGVEEKRGLLGFGRVLVVYSIATGRRQRGERVFGLRRARVIVRSDAELVFGAAIQVHYGESRLWLHVVRDWNRE